MRYIQTLYIDNTKDSMIDSFGWYKPKYHLMSWALSCLSLQKVLGQPIELYTNKAGKELLIDKLNLPYGVVNTSMSDWDLPHPQLWALPKIHTYNIQSSPFIHIDGDVYLFEKFPQRIETGEIVAQNIEDFTDYYYSAMHPIKKAFMYLPKYVQNDFKTLSGLRALNAGVIGGTNIDFFKMYSDEAFNYVYSNLSCLENININRFNVLFEQHLCYKMAESHQIKIEYLINDIYNDNGYRDFADFYKIPINKANYFHLLGDYKADEFTCRQMAETLRHLYPKYYYQIVNLFEEKDVNIPINEEKDKADRDIFLTGKENSHLNWEDINPCFDLLNHLDRYIDNTTDRTENEINKEKDYALFREEVVNTLCLLQKNYSDSYTNGRDIDSFYWHSDILGSKEQLDQLSHIIIKKAPMLKILTSKYNWARLYRKNVTNGIPFYNDFDYSDLEEGEFFALIINEKGFSNVSIYDINELEKCILSETNEPLSIGDLVLKLSVYAEEDVLNNHMKEFEKLIFELIKKMILIKSLMPINPDVLIKR